MATAKARAKPVRAVTGSNFEPKRIRKAKRKALIRAQFGNMTANVRAAAEDRAEFYRNLRTMKLKRRLIAREMRKLDGMMADLLAGVQHLGNRYPAFERAYGRALDEAMEICKAARVSTSVAADEWEAFAARKVYYVKEF